MSIGVVRTGIAAVLVLGTCVWLMTRDPGASMRSRPGADLPASGGTSLDVFGTGYVSVHLRQGTAHLLLPAPGSYDLSGRHWSGNGSTNLQCAPDTIEVGENGGSFQVTLRPK